MYPGYGVAIISKLVQRQIAGKQTNFYELKFFNKDMAVLVPEDKLESVGIRRLSSDTDLECMLKALHNPQKKTRQEIGVNNWNRRNKKYQIDLRSGDLFKLSSIYRDLQLIAYDKDLSFGERNLCSKIESMLIEEISAVKNINPEQAKDYLKKSFIAAKKSYDAMLILEDEHEAHELELDRAI